MHETAAFYTEQCTTPLLLHNFEVLQGAHSHSLKNYGLQFGTPFSLSPSLIAKPVKGSERGGVGWRIFKCKYTQNQGIQKSNTRLSTESPSRQVAYHFYLTTAQQDPPHHSHDCSIPQSLPEGTALQGEPDYSQSLLHADSLPVIFFSVNGG